MVLYGSCHDFSGRSGVFAHKNGQLPLCEESASLGVEHLPGGGPAFGVYDKVVLLEELVGHFKGGSQVSATVGSEVEDELLHALLFQLGNRLLDLRPRGSSEAVKLDVARGRRHHIAGAKGIYGNFIAFEGELYEVFISTAQNSERHLRAFWSAEHAHDAVALHFYAGNGDAIASDEAVAGDDARLLARPFRDGLDDDEGVFKNIELHADAFEVAFEGLVELLRLLGIGIGGMGVELFENTVDGILHEFFLIYAIYIELRDGELGNLQLSDHLYINVLIGVIVAQLRFS